jgi:hypothetical protein
LTGIVGELNIVYFAVFAHHNEFAMGGNFGLDICDIFGDLAFAIHRVFAMRNYRRDCCNFVFSPNEVQKSPFFIHDFVVAGRVVRS